MITPRWKPRPMPSLWRLVCLMLLAGSAYATTLGHGFVWDDPLLVVESRMIQRWTNLSRALVDDFFSDAAEWRGYDHRPLVTLSYMLDHALWGLRASGYHLTNVLLHVASTLLVYLVAPALGAGGSAACLASTVFGLHPIRSRRFCISTSGTGTKTRGSWISRRRSTGRSSGSTLASPASPTPTATRDTSQKDGSARQAIELRLREIEGRTR